MILKRTILLVLACTLIFPFSSCKESKKQESTVTTTQQKICTYGDFKYKINQNKVCITEYVGKEKGTLKVPDKIDGKTVTEITGSAFYRAPFKKVILPNTVEVISGEAFFHCSSLKSITLPDSLKEIYEGCFGKCCSLEKILVDENNKYFTSKNGVLYSKDMTVLYEYPENKTDDTFVVPKSVKEIKFLCVIAPFKKVYIGENVTKVGDGIFEFYPPVTFYAKKDSEAYHLLLSNGAKKVKFY